MAVKFVPCTSIEQADEMYWAGLLHFRLGYPWHPSSYENADIADRCKPSNIIGGFYNYTAGYLVEE